MFINQLNSDSEKFAMALNLNRLSSTLSVSLRHFRPLLFPRAYSSSSSPSSSSSSSAELDYKSYYNTQDIEKILKTVNEIPNLDDLQKFGIPKRAIKLLGEQRAKEEQVSNLDDLINILGVRSSFRAFGNILEKPNASVKNPMFPVPTEELVQKASQVVSVILNGGQVSWICIERTPEKNLLVKDWNYYTLPLKSSSKQHFISSLKEMVSLCNEKIPRAQLCIIEEYPTGAPNPQMFAYQLQITQLRSFLLGALASRPVEESRVIAIKTVAVARMFNTAVGSERVSGQHLVDNMVTWKPLPSLIVPNKLKDNYENYTPVIKEGLANSILLNLAYWRLTKQFTYSYS